MVEIKGLYTLDQLVPRAAKRNPDKLAFKYLNQVLTYADLDEKTNQLANYFINNGLKKGDRIGISLPRSIETPIAIYSVLKAGGVFVPLDTNMPSSRFEFIVNDCQIKFIICSNKSSDKINDYLQNNKTNLHTIGLNIDTQHDHHLNKPWQEIFDNEIKIPVNINIIADDLAYIMYTSGTTGMPKGIMHTHYSGLSYALLSQNKYEVAENDIIATHSPLHFDISTFGYITSPLSFATSIIISEAHTKFPLSLAQLIKKENITIWYSVPIALIQLSDQEILKSVDITTIRWVLFGGESYPTKKLKTLMAFWPNASYSNVYGPAEVNQCTYYTVPADINEEESVPLGKIWENTEMLIVNDQDQLVKKGDIGKLLISSSTMMYGYWSNEALSEKAFYIEVNPAMKNFHKKYYRTGDLVFINEEDNLMFLGRGDRQIKTRGFRVELNEVETVLLNISGVDEVAVFAYDNNEFGKLIGALVVLKKDSILNAQMIKSKLMEVLPNYCIPESIQITDIIKRTSAGKVDYKSFIP